MEVLPALDLAAVVELVKVVALLLPVLVVLSSAEEVLAMFASQPRLLTMIFIGSLIGGLTIGGWSTMFGLSSSSSRSFLC